MQALEDKACLNPLRMVIAYADDHCSWGTGLIGWNQKLTIEILGLSYRTTPNGQIIHIKFFVGVSLYFSNEPILIDEAGVLSETSSSCCFKSSNFVRSSTISNFSSPCSWAFGEWQRVGDYPFLSIVESIMSTGPHCAESLELRSLPLVNETLRNPVSQIVSGNSSVRSIHFLFWGSL